MLDANRIASSNVSQHLRRLGIGRPLKGVLIFGLVGIGALAFLTEDLSVAAPTNALCAGGLLVLSLPQRRQLTLNSLAAGFGVTGAVVSGWLWLLDSLGKLGQIDNVSLTVNLALLATQVILGMMAIGLLQSLWHEQPTLRQLRQRNRRNTIIAASIHFIITFAIIFGASHILRLASYNALELEHQLSGLDLMTYLGMSILLSGALRDRTG